MRNLGTRYDPSASSLLRTAVERRYKQLPPGNRLHDLYNISAAPLTDDQRQSSKHHRGQSTAAYLTQPQGQQHAHHSSSSPIVWRSSHWVNLTIHEQRPRMADVESLLRPKMTCRHHSAAYSLCGLRAEPSHNSLPAFAGKQVPIVYSNHSLMGLDIS